MREVLEFGGSDGADGDGEGRRRRREIDRTEDLYRARDHERLKAQLKANDLRVRTEPMFVEPAKTAEEEPG